MTKDDDGLVKVTPDGKKTAKAAKAAKAKKALKSKPAADAGPMQGKELVKRAIEGDEGARKALIKFHTCFERWKKALGDQREENRKAKELEGAAQAALENAMEAGLPANADSNAVFEKLRLAEQHWQEWQDAKAEAAQMRSDAADVVKKRAGELERAASDSAQLTIPGTD